MCTSLYLLTTGIGILQIEGVSCIHELAWICIISGIIHPTTYFSKYVQKLRFDNYGLQ
ncbi:hypothetical protein [Bacteroides nordii]|uniref:hypothetical protein n=1 Tax=Bacteroides nordii TaxID=291645 RepID=UPI00203EB28C